MSEGQKADVKLIREWQLASINHLEDVGSDGAVIRDMPPDGDSSLVCIAAIMDEDKANAFCMAVAELMNIALGTSMTPLESDKEKETQH